MPDLSRLSYSLQFDDDGIGLPRRVEFEASNAGAALDRRRAMRRPMGRASLQWHGALPGRPQRRDLDDRRLPGSAS